MPAMPALDLERIGFLTRRCNQLQGLRHIVPFGLLILHGGLLSLAGKHVLVVSLAVGLPLLAIALWLQWHGGAYYRARIGVVQEASELYLGRRLVTSKGDGTRVPDATITNSRYGLFMLLGMPCVAAALALAGFTESLPKMAAGAYLLVSVGSFGTWWISREHRADQAHYLLFAALTFVLAGRGAAWGVLPPTMASLHLMRAVVSAGLVVCGLIDHWQLMHHLGGTAAAHADGVDA
jgi:hypothetical protein